MSNKIESPLLDGIYAIGHQRIILHLDLLGFKDIVMSHSLRTLVEEIQKRIAITIGRKRDDSARIWAAQKFGYSYENPPIEGHLWFSDTIIFYTKDSSGWALVTIVEFAREFVAELLAQGLPVRGSIVCGMFHASAGTEGSFVGEALIKAYELEKKQDWCKSCLA